MNCSTCFLRLTYSSLELSRISSERKMQKPELSSVIGAVCFVESSRSQIDDTRGRNPAIMLADVSSTCLSNFPSQTLHLLVHSTMTVLRLKSVPRVE